MERAKAILESLRQQELPTELKELPCTKGAIRELYFHISKIIEIAIRENYK